MKIYTQKFDLNERTDRQFFVPQWSQYKIGLQVKENGQLVSSSRIKLYDGATEIIKDNELYNDYILFTRNSTNSTSKNLIIKVDGSEKFHLQETVTDSTVYDIDATGTQYVLPIAQTSTLGGIKVGANLNIDSNGVLSASGSSYELSIASENTLGGVKVNGNGIAISDNGTLSCTISSYELPYANETELGGIKIGRNLIWDIAEEEYGVVAYNPIFVNEVQMNSLEIEKPEWVSFEMEHTYCVPINLDIVRHHYILDFADIPLTYSGMFGVVLYIKTDNPYEGLDNQIFFSVKNLPSECSIDSTYLSVDNGNFATTYWSNDTQYYEINDSNHCVVNFSIRDTNDAFKTPNSMTFNRISYFDEMEEYKTQITYTTNVYTPM